MKTGVGVKGKFWDKPPVVLFAYKTPLQLNLKITFYKHLYTHELLVVDKTMRSLRFREPGSHESENLSGVKEDNVYVSSS